MVIKAFWGKEEYISSEFYRTTYTILEYDELILLYLIFLFNKKILILRKNFFTPEFNSLKFSIKHNIFCFYIEYSIE